MSHEHRAQVAWSRNGGDFSNGRYSRQHRWSFDGGMVVAASASPYIVPPPWSAADAVDPEEAFVASLSSCHMLFFLSLAAQRGLIVDSYEDEAVGMLAADERGRLTMTSVVLKPSVRLSATSSASDELLAELHQGAHEACFLANSVRSNVVIKPRSVLLEEAVEASVQRLGREARDVEFLIADVFTREPYRGNQLAVLPDAQALSPSTMQAIAREFNFAETTFVLPAAQAGALRRVRIFTPQAELPFAGHPTLGTAAVLVHLGLAGQDMRNSTIMLEEAIGPISVEVRPDGGAYWCRLTLDGEIERADEDPSLDLLAPMLSLPNGAVRHAWYGGRGPRFCFVHLSDIAAVDAASLDREIWSRSLSNAWSPHLFIFAGQLEPGSRLHARMFAPALGITEDPATGSAAAILAGVLALQLAAGDGESFWFIDQGVAMGRPSAIEAAAVKTDGRIACIRVGGDVCVHARGSMQVPFGTDRI